MFKTLSTITLFGLLTLSAAHAQSTQPVRANIPFAFQVQNQTLPAGTYQLTYSSTAHVFSMRGVDQGVFVPVSPAGDSHIAGGDGKLVFECYDKTCYLAQVWQSADFGGAAFQLPRTTSERRISLSTRAVSIVVAAK